jgi:hypothetical protein
MAKKKETDTVSKAEGRRQAPVNNSSKRGDTEQRRITRSSAKEASATTRGRGLAVTPESDNESNTSKVATARKAKSTANKKNRDDLGADHSDRESPDQEASDGPVVRKKLRTDLTHATTALKSAEASRGRRLGNSRKVASSSDEDSSRAQMLGRPDAKAKVAHRGTGVDRRRHVREMSLEQGNSSDEEHDHSNDKVRDLERRLKIAEGQ